MLEKDYNSLISSHNQKEKRKNFFDYVYNILLTCLVFRDESTRGFKTRQERAVRFLRPKLIVK